MIRRFRLASVLRARTAQENAAKAAVLSARLAEQDATDRREDRERRLLDRPMVNGGSASWYVAAVSARQALAGELTAAARLAEEAAAIVDDRAAELTTAAVRRRSVEALAERHAAAVAAADLAADQRAVDEIATSRRTNGGTGQ